MRAISMFAVVLAMILEGCGDDGPKSPLDEAEPIGGAKTGLVSLATYSDGKTGYQYTVRPSFIDASASGRCTVQENGSCRKISCPTSRSSLRSASAGGIHINAGQNTADLIPDYNGYTNVQEGRPFLSGGEELSFRADGATVPSFSASVTAPSAVLITAPLDETVVVSGSKDLTFSWTGDSAGVIVFQISGTIDGTDLKLQCRFLPAAGTATIPGSAFAMMPAGKYSADVFTRSRSIVKAGDWSVATEGVYFAGVKDLSAYSRPARVE